MKVYLYWNRWVCSYSSPWGSLTGGIHLACCSSKMSLHWLTRGVYSCRSEELEKWSSCLPGRLSLFAEDNLRVLCKQIWVTSCHRLVCLQCPWLPSWAALLFVFGFAGDSLCSHRSGPIVEGQTQTLENADAWKMERTHKGKVAIIAPLFLDVSLLFQSQHCHLYHCPHLLSVIDSELWLLQGSLWASDLETMKTAQFQAAVCPWLTAPCGPHARGQ